LRFKPVLNILSRLLLIESFFMLLCVPISLIYSGNDVMAFLYSAAISLVTGLSVYFLTKNANHNPGKREGYFIVTFGWIVLSCFGALPFYIQGAIPSYTDAFFETISGFTTTGASILTDIESMDKGLLFWRSLTQWIGGMGIIVLTIAIIPFLGIGGMQMFVAEVPGPAPDKLHPRITATAKSLWYVYVLFTAIEVILLMFGGMNWFDAVCHSFTTMATGGYSTKNASIAAFDSSYIHYVLTFFMFLAGVNFSLSFFALKGNFKKVWKNEELKFYTSVLLIASLIISLVLIINKNVPIGIAIRDALFQVVSITTTTGYATADYGQWTLFGTMVIFVLFFVGGSAGSTGGSIKVIRILLIFRNTSMEFRRLMHPRGVIPVRYNGKVVNNEIVSNILAFFFIYIIIFVFSSLIMMFTGLDLETSVGSVAATLGNIGPGIGDVGPTGNFAEISIFGKWYLSFLMLIGRLELFTVLILFSKAFWRQ
jgi:trk system potassium uptake protein TrkH